MTTATLPLTNHQIATGLADARWLIINYGWRQFIVGDVQQGFSADGAILAATGHRLDLHVAARRTFQATIGGYEPSPWNDHYSRTWDEVLCAFLDAEANARTGEYR